MSAQDRALAYATSLEANAQEAVKKALDYMRRTAGLRAQVEIATEEACDKLLRSLEEQGMLEPEVKQTAKGGSA